MNRVENWWIDWTSYKSNCEDRKQEKRKKSNRESIANILDN